MSQTTMSPARESFPPEPSRPRSESLPRPADVRPFDEEFDYRPVPLLAPVSAFLGVCSAVALFGVFGIIVALVGTLLGGLCLLKIVRSEGELGGRVTASIGLTLSVLFFISGAAVNAHAYATEVPEGYERVNFTREISKKEFVFEDGVRQIHPDVRALDGKQIFLKGYMYPERQTTGLTRFVLVKDSGECCFGGNPSINDMVLVEMQDGKTVNYRLGMVAVAGTFRARDPGQTAELTTIYKLEGDFFDRARTGF